MNSKRMSMVLIFSVAMWLVFPQLALGQEPLCEKQTTLVLVVDRSGSMGEDDKMPLLKDALKGFLDLFEHSDSLFGLVSFNNQATVDQELTGRKRPVERAIDGLSPQGATSIVAGIEAAVGELNAQGNPANPVIVLSSDGLPTKETPDEVVVSVESAMAEVEDLRVFAVGIFGSDSEEYVAGVQMLGRIAEAGNGAWRNAEEPEALAELFEEIAAEVCPPRPEIAYVSEPLGGSEIYTMNPDGSGQTKIGPHPDTDDWAPKWKPGSVRSREKRLVAFASDKNGEGGIFIMDEDGNLTQELGDTGCWDTAPNWSPDGQQLIWFGNCSPEKRIFVAEVGSGNFSQVALGDFPAWTPDGQRIVFSRWYPEDSGIPRGIWTMDPDGSNPVQLTLGPDDWYPRPSPDGRWVAFSRRVGSKEQVWLVRIDGSESHILFQSGVLGYAWSPDGQLAFVAHVEDVLQLWTTMPSSGGLRVHGQTPQLLASLPIPEGEIGALATVHESWDPTWSPNGQQIMFGGPVDCLETKCFEILAINTDRTGLILITDNEKYDGQPDWWWSQDAIGTATELELGVSASETIVSKVFSVTITLASHGPSPATESMINFTLPVSTALLSAPLSCTLGGDIVTCSPGRVIPGLPQNLAFGMKVDEKFRGILTTTVVADSAEAITPVSVEIQITVWGGNIYLPIVLK